VNATVLIKHLLKISEVIIQQDQKDASLKKRHSLLSRLGDIMEE
jgi:hypothetical protein